jgi:iron complex transport system ATP-binding protein
MTLEVRNLSCGYSAPILENVSFQIKSGEILCLLGANGSGKTTLFKTLLKLINPLSGQILLDGESISHIPLRRFAQNAAYVAQQHVPPFPYLVRDVVLLGRVSSTGYIKQPNKSDVDIAERAIAETGITHLKDRAYTDISGGERQLVLIARALAQTPKLLLLDEPTANLDYGNQMKIIGTIRSLAKSGYAVIMTTHSPDHAFQCGGSAAVITKGGLFEYGTVDEVLTERRLSEIYGIRIRVLKFTDEDGSIKTVCSPSPAA